MRLTALVCALGLFACSGEKAPGGEPLGFSPLPDGLPAMTGWETVSGQGEEPLGGVAAGKAQGIQLAELLVSEGLCPDTDEDCVVTMRFEVSRTYDERTGAVDAVFRWVLQANGRRVEGVARGSRPDAGSPATYAYWRRVHDTWAARAQGTPEHEFDDRLHETLGALMAHVRTHGSH